MPLPAKANFNGVDVTALPVSNTKFTVVTGSMGLWSNSVSPTGGSIENCCRWNYDTFANDQQAQIVITDLVDGYFIGPAVRCQSGSVGYYNYYEDIDSRYFFKMVGGTATDLVAPKTSVTNNIGDVLRIEAEGTTIRAYLNGSLDTGFSTTDSSHSSGSAGVSGFGIISGTNNDTLGDTWQADNIPATTPNYIPMLYAETTGDVTDTGGAPWTPAASISVGHNWVGSKEYLILASAFIECSSGTAQCHVRLVHGTTPTVFTDGDCVIDPPAANGGYWAFWMYRFTQPSTPEAVTIELQGEGAATVTCLMSQIFAMQLTDYLTENTDFYWNEVTVDYTTTTTPTAQATVTFTPNGTDTWLLIGHAIEITPAAATNNVNLYINDSVGPQGYMNAIMEGEDTGAGAEARHVGMMVPLTPTAASHSYSVHTYHSSTNTFVIASSRILALKLNKFQQKFGSYSGGDVNPANSPTWTNVTTASVTPTVTGEWFYMGEFVGQMVSTSNELNVRLQDDNDGSMGSDPDYGDNGMNPPAWDNTNYIMHGLFKMKQLTSGASRTVNLDATRLVGSPVVSENSIVGFSAELATAAQTFVFQRRQNTLLRM